MPGRCFARPFASPAPSAVRAGRSWAGVYTGAQQLAGVRARFAHFGQRHFSIDAKGQCLVFAVVAVVHPPVFVELIDQHVRRAAVAVFVATGLPECLSFRIKRSLVTCSTPTPVLVPIEGQIFRIRDQALFVLHESWISWCTLGNRETTKNPRSQ